MKVIKKINNNFAICLDRNNNELIAYGRGIGFPQIPYELDNLSKIDRTFYGINSMYINLINELSEEIINASYEIVEVAANTIEKELNTNIVFTLADHINFAIQRTEEGIKFKMPLIHEIKHLYPKEMEIGNRSLVIIKKILKIELPREEAASIAMHFINAEKTQQVITGDIDEREIIDSITKIIEEDFSIVISKEGLNYSRFVSHIQYLLKRRDNETSISSDNKVLFDTMKSEFSNAYLCAKHIKDYLHNNFMWDISDEELLYMILHINRLCVREDCHR